MTKPYPDVAQGPKFSEIEEKVLKRWADNKTFQRSVDIRPVSDHHEYVFYDGPPFANGLPHYGHLLTGFIKDLIPRYQTMRGKRVERRFGWDCHGLPAEMEAEKELKVSGRKQIEEYGIGKFNDYCRSSVQRYTGEWERYVRRQARWVDFKNDYKTMDLPYMESVMWAFKALYDKGLIYEGLRVMPYSWACETPLSNFEIRLDNAYRERQDPALTIGFLANETSDGKPLRYLAWTTTPWTLPSNLALAVGPEIDYALIELKGTRYVLGAAILEKYENELKGHTLVRSLKGQELVGKTYEPLFPYFKDAPNAFRILGAEFVSTEEGTGIVHMAPGFGEDDQIVSAKHGIQIVCPVDDHGRFTSEVSDYQGQQVFDANKEIIKDLKARGMVLRHETYLHNYPHCWRTDTPVIYRAISSWYVKVTDFKDRMVELNQQIRWIPEHIRDGQFGKWLQNARDWSISRSRFWGSPIPIWRSDDPKYPRLDCYGSIAEIEKDFGVKITDLHRPYIDSLVRLNPNDPTGKSMMRRVPDVLDCWFESGSMPFAQIHYPFENKEWFEGHFPADFIVEYVAQTRGWFYTLMVLATALFDKPPFLNCVCHGVVLDEDGQKLSKRLKNYPSPEEVFSTHGADALRWFLVSSGIVRGSDLQIDREGKLIGEVVRTVINPIWNAYYFFTLYANSDGIRAGWSSNSPVLLDRYILAKTRALIESVSTRLDAYDLAGAAQDIMNFLDALNNWYIRRSRDRFWKHEQDDDKKYAYNTLFTVLETICRVSAPYLPLITEDIFTGLSGKESVHLESWPDPAMFPADAALVESMDRVREICSAGLSLREAKNLRTRLPLSEMVVSGTGVNALAEYEPLIREELNVKKVTFGEDSSQYGSFQIQVNMRELGPRIGDKMKDVLAATRSGAWKILPTGNAEIAGVELEPTLFSMILRLKDGITGQALSDNRTIVVLDTAVTPELREEGVARDLVRLVQQARKNAGLHIADHIELSITVPEALRGVLKKHERYISEQTLADALAYDQVDSAGFTEQAELDSQTIAIGIRLRK